MTDTPTDRESVEALALMDEQYDTMMEVEKDPTGAFLAIEAMSATLRALLSRAEKAEAERDALREAAKHVDHLPPGVWEVWTSCSFRRISEQFGPDGGVLHATVHSSDGHPDLSWSERQCQAACDLVNGLRAALNNQEEDG